MYQTLLKICKNPIFVGGKVYITYGFMEPKYGGPHYGSDLVPGAPGMSDDVTAIADGVIEYVKSSVSKTLPLTSTSHADALGNNIKITHNDKYMTRYCHLKYNSIKVKPGDKVKKGQVIATIGNTGCSTGLHVHFEVWENGVRVNPESFIIGEKSLTITQSVKTNVKTFKKTTIDALNLRTQPSTDGEIILTIPKGASVELEDENTWVKATYKDSGGKIRTGFCAAGYLK
ncbi:MAG: M23 family metallopeptidase [Eubacterium sp.]|jgi:hypothetical protein|nr:M23 family metallopeptidase [Eubacterium sp.]